MFRIPIVCACALIVTCCRIRSVLALLVLETRVDCAEFAIVAHRVIAIDHASVFTAIASTYATD